MSITTLIVIGMVEIFIIAMAWVRAWVDKTEMETKSAIMATVITSFTNIDNDKLDEIEELLNKYSE